MSVDGRREINWPNRKEGGLKGAVCGMFVHAIQHKGITILQSILDKEKNEGKGVSL